MRHFPKNTDLSDEQKIIYSEHLDKALLITGPPGTGKTVMAIMRALRMGKEMEDVNAKVPILMHNKTLYEFTSTQASVNKNIKVQTLMSYLLQRTNLRMLSDGQNISFPWGQLYRMIDSKNPDEIKKLNLFPKFVILDEGQDFPKTLWKVISNIWMKLRSVDVNFVPSIMADENQALNVDENSTIDDIRHGLSTTDCFGSFKESKLTKNYRNTKEIAAFAEKFYVGNQTEKADSSQCRSGVKPKLFWHRGYKNNRLIERIVNYKKSNPNKSVGVIIVNRNSASRVKTLFKGIENYVKINKLDIKVQYYLSSDRQRIQALDFDNPKTITVITRQSCKGLEFDCVFVPKINDLEYDNLGFEYSRDLYVVFHRARDQLFITAGISADEEKDNIFAVPPILKNHLKTRDYRGKTIDVGFRDEDELLSYIDVDRNLDREQRSKAEEILKQRQREKLLSDENIESKKEQVKENSSSIKLKAQQKNIRIQKIYNAASLFIEKKKWTIANDKLLRESISALGGGDQGILLAKWERKGQKDNRLPKIKIASKKTKKKIKSPLLELDFVTGSDGIFLRLLDIIKETLLNDDHEIIQIISSKKKPKRVFKKVSNLLTNNKAGISDAIMPDMSSNMIHFFYKGRKRIIKIISPNDEVDWFKKIILLGMEDLKSEDISGDIQELLLNLFLKPAHNTCIIHPNTDEETPGVKYMYEKNDDGNLIKRYHEY